MARSASSGDTESLGSVVFGPGVARPESSTGVVRGHGAHAHARRLTVSDNGKVVQRYTVAVGRPSAPTPTGRFAVTDRLLTGNPSGPYGCCILALSAKSPHAIQGWTGGNRIAIHSTPETSTAHAR